MIDELPILVPDRTRAARVVSQCHKRLRRDPPVTIERAITAGFCAVYAMSVLANALRVLLTA
ncbi:MAG TPA: hypothetical protein VM096_20430 [Vicinamibacterales bacterium]|nr:hypothetical protein [Vicinamibacterales bacterium]